ncbi:MAG: glucose-1-phosphate cytidylyltransferase [Chitinophagaceae bacterium]|nr:MAG: glucose-1-phosphate cytidylyltransferase [Bacteroidetes bacterium OLB11]MCC6447846.1 glucose-1-phosphate cytidylyltransferase [Chitinophagaceae bacterium]HMN32855.1 glucose-1-phosphate cytidylyltransferase [Chitinophagaceae bacterium]
MKVVIFAGGLGTRISEESHLKPKPMIEIGGKPILWHIMNIYAAHGYCEFIICCGYKGTMIKEYFTNYYLHNSDLTVNLKNNVVDIHNSNVENFKITMIDTGLDTMTAGRLKRVLPYTNNEPFMLTYGDGVSDINIKELVNFHKQHGKICTMTTIQPSSRFGVVNMDEDGTVIQFEEKPEDSNTWINGGFFVLQPEIKNYLNGDNFDKIMWERKPMYDLAKDKNIVGYKHHGFWKCMDTMRDKEELEKLWETNPIWKKW